MACRYPAASLLFSCCHLRVCLCIQAQLSTPGRARGEGEDVTIPVLQMGKLRHRGVVLALPRSRGKML